MTPSPLGAAVVLVGAAGEIEAWPRGRVREALRRAAGFPVRFAVDFARGFAAAFLRAAGGDFAGFAAVAEAVDEGAGAAALGRFSAGAGAVCFSGSSAII